MHSDVDYTIVIPTFNSEQLLRELLDGIVTQVDLYPPSSIIIVDDNSNDDTKYLPKIFESNLIPIKYIKLDEQVGPLLAEKRGIEEVQTEIFVSIHADVQIGIRDNKANQHPIDKIVCYLIKMKDMNCESIAAVAPWTLQAEAHYLIQGSSRAISNDGIPFSMNRQKRFRSLVRIPRTRFEPVLSMDSYCYAMLKNIYDEVQGFDEDFSPYFFYHDDLWGRVREKGYSIFTTTQTVVYHPNKPGHKTETFLSVNDPDIYDKNLKLFLSKWEDNPIWEYNSQFKIIEREPLMGGFVDR